MPSISIFKDFIKDKGLRWTPQRQTILEVFSNIEEHLTAEEIFQKVVIADSSIGIATVYRTMALLTEAGLAREGINFRGKTTFEPSYLKGHHDHLICTQCGKILEFEHPLIEKYQNDVCRIYDFHLQYHRMELYGVCKECSLA